MLNLKQLVASKDSVTKLNDSITKTTFNAVKPYFKIYYQANRYKSTKTLDSLDFKKQKIFAGISKNQKEMVVVSAKENAKMVKEAVLTINAQSTDYTNIIRRYLIEYNKKFTLAFSCLVLFFIGAPLGAIIRKGGLGLPVVVSVVFFLIYHIISTVGEKYVKGGNLSPVVGMWLAIFVLTPVGLFLTYKATIDSALFDVDAYKNLYKKVFYRKKKN